MADDTSDLGHRDPHYPDLAHAHTHTTDDCLTADVPWDFVTDTLPKHVLPTTLTPGLPPRTSFREQENA
jgi:hypothetical protein